MQTYYQHFILQLQSYRAVPIWIKNKRGYTTYIAVAATTITTASAAGSILTTIANKRKESRIQAGCNSSYFSLMYFSIYNAL